ncbi:MAG: MMPL family transporter, partial [Deltaproteobacteria bacterium]|nr:MMPL family transporter [Deltaproteobacteria bacterium]
MREQKGQESIFTRLALLIGGFAGEHCRSSLGIILGLTVILLPSLGQVEYDDDILKFLPEDSPQVSQFQEIGERFQGLNIAMLGVQAPANEDLFTPRRLRELRELTETLTTVEGVSFSSSFMALQDIEVQKSDDGLDDVSVVNDLIPEIPPVDSPEVKVFVEDARKRVLSREHVVGAMISEDGKAALVLGYLKPGTIGKDVADAIRKHADGLLAKNQSDLEIHYGGAPFVGSYIVHTTRDDILRLSLISGCAIIFILILTARSLTGALIALSSVGIGILWVVGLMGLVGEPLTLVSSSLPMLLLALGSAYSIHILVRVFAHLDSGSVDRLTAVREAVREVGPPIFIAGLTSALAFLSFVAMDIAPMRSFGVWMFVGTLVIVFLALVVVPAACVLFPLPVREGGRTPAWALKGMIDGANFVIRKPWLTAVVIGILVGGSWVYMGEGKTHMTMRDFFLEGSEPVLAEDFLEDHLGGSVYMQIQVTGDIKDPLVLMEIDRIATYAAAQPGVTNTQSIMDAMLLAGEALFGERRVPANPDTVRAIAALAEGDPNLRLIVDPKWEHALIHVKVRNENIADALAFAKRLEAVEGASWQVDRVRVTRSTMTDAEAEVERREMISHLVSVLEKDGIQGVSNAA